jgi:hypothetical protein
MGAWTPIKRTGFWPGRRMTPIRFRPRPKTRRPWTRGSMRSSRHSRWPRDRVWLSGTDNTPAAPQPGCPEPSKAIGHPHVRCARLRRWPREGARPPLTAANCLALPWSVQPGRKNGFDGGHLYTSSTLLSGDRHKHPMGGGGVTPVRLPAASDPKGDIPTLRPQWDRQHKPAVPPGSASRKFTSSRPVRGPRRPCSRRCGC